jgi:hypothetical protein
MIIVLFSWSSSFRFRRVAANEPKRTIVIFYNFCFQYYLFVGLDSPGGDERPLMSIVMQHDSHFKIKMTYFKAFIRVSILSET